MHQILGLDPGENIGFAHIGLNEQREIKLLSYGIVPIPDNLFLDTYQWLSSYLHTNASINALSYESAAFGQIYVSREKIYTLQVQGIIEMVAYEMSLPAHSFMPKSVKAAIIGGNAKKAQLRKAVKSFLNLPTSIQSNHMTDAISIACCAALHVYKAKWPKPVMEQPQLPFPDKAKRKHRKPKLKDLTEEQIRQAVIDNRAEYDGKGRIVGVR